MKRWGGTCEASLSEPGKALATGRYTREPLRPQDSLLTSCPSQAGPHSLFPR